MLALTDTTGIKRGVLPRLPGEEQETYAKDETRTQANLLAKQGSCRLLEAKRAQSVATWTICA